MPIPTTDCEQENTFCVDVEKEFGVAGMTKARRADTKRRHTNLRQRSEMWVHTTMRPMLRCFRNHWESNIERFTDRWDEKCNVEFAKTCCMGSTESGCGTCYDSKKSNKNQDVHSADA